MLNINYFLISMRFENSIMQIIYRPRFKNLLISQSINHNSIIPEFFMRYLYLLICACIISLFAVSCDKNGMTDDNIEYPSLSIDLTNIDKNTGCPNYYIKAFIEPKTDISNYYIGVVNLEVDPKSVVNSFDDLIQYTNQNLAIKARLSAWKYNNYYMFATSFASDCYKEETDYIGRGFVITDSGSFLWTDPFKFSSPRK